MLVFFFYSFFLIITFIINNLNIKSSLIYVFVLLGISFLSAKINILSFIEIHSNIYNFINNKISLLHSLNEHTVYIILILISFSSFLFYNSKKKFYRFIINTNNNLYKLLFLVLLLIYNYFEYNNNYGITLSQYNIILDHSLISLHPPLILVGIILLRMKINYFYSYMYDDIYYYKIFAYTPLTIYYLFIILVLGIISGSIWSTNLFGWGGWWIWDPIENICFIYWLLVILLFHVNITFALLLLVCVFITLLDFIFFCVFKLNLLSSLHVFQNSLYLIQSNYFVYTFIAMFYVVLLTFIISHYYSRQNKTLLFYFICFFILSVLLTLYILNILSKLFVIDHIPNSLANLFYLFCYYFIFVEFIKYSRTQFIINQTLIYLVFLCFFCYIYMNNFIPILISIITPFFSMNSYKKFYASNHFLVFFILSVLIGFQTVEYSFVYNYISILSQGNNAMYSYLTVLLYEIGNIQFDLNLFVYRINNSIFLYNENSISYLSSYFAQLNNSIQDKNELFMVNTNTDNLLLQYGFNSLKLNNIMYMFLVIISTVFILLFLFYYLLIKKISRFTSFRIFY